MGTINSSAEISPVTWVAFYRSVQAAARGGSAGRFAASACNVTDGVDFADRWTGVFCATMCMSTLLLAVTTVAC